jgi:hypothetical protein
VSDIEFGISPKQRVRFRRVVDGITQERRQILTGDGTVERLCA